jgi:hypothetical protein
MTTLTYVLVFIIMIILGTIIIVSIIKKHSSVKANRRKTDYVENNDDVSVYINVLKLFTCKLKIKSGSKTFPTKDQKELKQ